MKLFLYLCMASILSFFGGCGMKYYKEPQPALIVLKSPGIKYADMGFVYRGKNSTKVQIYASGQPAFTLILGKRVCMDSKCMSEREFYKKYMKADYPPGTLTNIFSKRPIFGGDGLERDGKKSVQRIKKEGRFDIIYTFDETSARFRDRLNHILIKITER